MVWPDIEPPQHQHAAANEWELEPQSLRYAFPPPPLPLANDTPSRMANVDMTRPPSASDLNANAGGSGTGGLTYSASCPSFTALYELSSDDDLIRDLQASGAHHAPLPIQTSRVNGFLPSAMPSAGLLQPAPLPHNSHGLQDHDLALPPPPFSTDKSYDFLVQMQHEHLDPSMRQFPHQQAHFHATGGIDHFALFSQPRRPLHASASFTSLSSMETEYRRQSASKRKKAGAERWHKMQRHKSFDSTGTSPATSMEFSTYSGAGSSQFASTPEHNFLDEVPDADMIGFSIDDFPSNFTSDASWPVPLTLGGGIPFEAYVAGDAASVHASDAADPSTSGSASAAAATDLLDLDGEATSAALNDADASEHQQTPSDIDLLLSDHERANMSSLFDAIRDFEAPAAPASEPAPVATTTSASTTSSATKPKQRRATGAKKRTHSPPLHPSKPQASTVDKRTTASAPLLALPPTASESPAPSSPPVPSVRERLETALARAHGRDVARTPLTDTERVYLETSPLFAPARVSETAGSLWLILHAARCEFGCEIAGCSVMRRVVRHCLSCDAVVGQCKDPCNEAKTIMLHIGACGLATCGVCRKLREIDHAHNAIQPSPPTNVAIASLPIPLTSNSCGHPSHGRVPIAPQPPAKSSSAPSSSPSLRPLASAKHVPIQPNLMPTASNPMGLLGAFPTFGFSLALYLEQTSATFRAEVKARVEKRVTAAAGQDLIQHMQKKTRLRSLDDLRADARTLVLGELERELHLHMQAYTWAANNAASGDALPPQLGGHECMLPPYLLSVAATGFATFYAQQASFHAAVTGMTAAAAAAAAAPSPAAASPAPVATTTPPLARRKASIGSAPNSAKTSTTTLKAGISATSRAGKKAADAAVAV